MTDLFEKSIQTLELPKVLEKLADLAATQEGKDRCLVLRPLTDADDEIRSKAEVFRSLDELRVVIYLRLKDRKEIHPVIPCIVPIHRLFLVELFNCRILDTAYK